MKKIFTFLLIVLPVTMALAQQTSRNLNWDGIDREYIEYIPSVYNSETPSPVMFCLHGLDDNMSNFHSSFQLNQWGEQANWIIITPQALMAEIAMLGEIGTAWNSGAGTTVPYLGEVILNNNVDDPGFLIAILDSLENNYSINTDSIFFMGFSLGGFMSNKMGILHGDRITAIAAVSGTIGNAVSSLTPITPTKTIHFHGTADATITYENAGFDTGMGVYPVGLGAEQTVEFWRNFNNCNAEPIITYFPNIKDDGLTFERYLYQDGNEGSQTAFIKIIGGEHNWYYSPVNDIDYNTEIYKFFTNTMDFPTAVTNISNSNISVFPNPASEQIFVSQEFSKLSIFDITGKLVLNIDNNFNQNIDISSLSNGLYIVRINSDGNIYENKLQIIK